MKRLSLVCASFLTLASLVLAGHGALAEATKPKADLPIGFAPLKPAEFKNGVKTNDSQTGPGARVDSARGVWKAPAGFACSKPGDVAMADKDGKPVCAAKTDAQKQSSIREPALGGPDTATSQK